MLVLTRKLKESLVIGENIRVIILEVSGDQVKLGIEAPREISVYRHEIFEAIQEANRLAAQSTDLAALEQILDLTKKK
ncbi:MAG: carbon storage regulator CsrA [Syntrophomonadaceae bacterium]|nr:carbon storage regulator CsrA [Syntrophomonadaceae bacterium]